MRFKYLVIGASILFLGVLYLLLVLAQPENIDIADTGSYEGKKVVMEGVLYDYYAIDGGGAILSIRNESDATSSITVFLACNANGLSCGDILRVTGKVELYENEWELVVDSKDDLRIMGNTGDNTTRLWELGGDIPNYLDIEINLTGEISNIHATYFYINDGRMKLKVLCEGGTADDFYSEDIVAARGIFRFDEENFSYYLDCRGFDAAVTPYTESGEEGAD